MIFHSLDKVKSLILKPFYLEWMLNPVTQKVWDDNNLIIITSSQNISQILTLNRHLTSNTISLFFPFLPWFRGFFLLSLLEWIIPSLFLSWDLGENFQLKWSVILIQVGKKVCFAKIPNFRLFIRDEERIYRGDHSADPELAILFFLTLRDLSYK